MPQYFSPGVYVEEVDKGPKPIEGVGTAVAGFAGFAERGPFSQPTFIANWTQFLNSFGGFMPNFYLAHAVYGYFHNGGGSCFVTRLALPGQQEVPSAPKPAVALPSRASPAQLSLRLEAREAREVTAEVAPPTDEAEDHFDLILRSSAAEERYESVSLGKGRGVTNVEEALKQSKLAKATVLDAPGTLAERVPAFGTYTLTVATEAALPVLKMEPKSIVGEAAERSGVSGLEVAEDVTMLLAPDLMALHKMGALDREGVKAVQTAMLDHAANLKDRVAIIDSLPGMTPQEVKTWRMEEASYDSKYGALYYPWIKVANPFGNGATLTVPASGHMAGIWARNDTERGVHKAPANEIVRGAVGVEYQVTKSEQDSLNPVGINCVRAFPGRGIRVWGARTLSSDPAWRYLNVRRLFNWIEESIEEGTQWVVFEPNNIELWDRVKRDIRAFLSRVWRDGALFGATSEEAFYVKCDEELNPPEVRDVGQLIIEIGLAPVKPAEFVIFRVSQWAAGSEVSE